MGQQIVLQMIVKRFRSPNHSSNREIDDSHEIKKQILKEVKRQCKELGKQHFSKTVGRNPDIGEENGILILKGREGYKGKIFRTIIPTDTYFGLQLISTIYGQFEVSLILFDKEGNENRIIEFDDIYLIPNDEQIIEVLFERIFANYLSDEGIRRSMILVTR